MDTLLFAALSNAAFVAVLTPILSVFGRVSRRPALVHSLWLVVFLKLLTPPFWSVPFSWLVESQTGHISPGSIAHEPGSRPMPAKKFTEREATAEEIDSALLQQYVPAAPADSFRDITPPLQKPDLNLEASSPPELSTPPDAPAGSTAALQSWLVAIWLSGSALWLGLAGYRLYRFHRLLEFTQPASAILQARTRRLADLLGLPRCPQVRVVSAPVSPLLWAVVGQPRLVVPQSLLERLTEEQWDTLLAHELAHLRRRDHWVRILEMTALAMYWWHPLVWWARRELREAEEQCCDAWVVWALPAAADVYATALIETVTYLSSARSALPLAASGIGQMHLLKRRVTMIMRGTTPRALSAAGSLAVLGLAAVLLPLYPTWAQTDQRPEGAPDKPSSGATAAEPGTFGRAAMNLDTAVSDHPNSGAATAVEGGDTEPRTLYGPMIPGGGRGYSETVEDIQDEMDLLRVQLEQRRAERREVEARLRQAQRTLERAQELVASRSIDRSEVDKLHSEVEIQEARLAGKDAQIKEAELRLKQAQRRLAKLRAQPQPEERTTAPEKSSYPSQERPTGSAIPPSPSQRYMARPGYGGSRRGAGSGGTSAAGATAPGGFPQSSAQGTAPGGGFGSFSGGTGLGGGMPGTSFSGGMGGFSGGMGPPGANASAYERRLAEVEKKLQALMDEMKSLRKQHPDEPGAKP